jgi:predicted HTH transcriptional regulator
LLEQLKSAKEHIEITIDAEDSWYFRNALVRANYNNIKKGIYETTEYLELFLQNLLLDQKNELHNREMHVSGRFSRKQDIDPIKQDIDPINDPIKYKDLNEREKKIVGLLREEPTLTRSKMAEILGCSDATIKRALQSMVQKNIICRIGSNKKGEWIIH